MAGLIYEQDPFIRFKRHIQQNYYIALIPSSLEVVPVLLLPVQPVECLVMNHLLISFCSRKDFNYQSPFII